MRSGGVSLGGVVGRGFEPVVVWLWRGCCDGCYLRFKVAGRSSLSVGEVFPVGDLSVLCFRGCIRMNAGIVSVRG